MEEKNYKYDAFISYRHCELDKFVAENLHRILENYEMPKNLKQKLNIKGKAFKRVFRDQEELPLSSNLEDPIVDALENSKYLIVICSPRLKASMWCKKEIETFKKLRGRKNIFCVLIEGEPSDSFPEEVLFDEKVKKGYDGKITTEKIMVEPLAADVRGENKKQVLKKMKSEKLRLIAPMYNLDYDDLKQRHKLKKQKQIIISSISIASFCLLFAIYTSVMLIKINNQQKILKLHQALSLSSDAERYLKNDNRYDAIKSSYEALTKFNGVKMPYTTGAEYALTESLGIYDVGASYKAISELKTKGVADYIKSSESNKFAAVYDESEEITLFDTKTLYKIASYKVKSSSTIEYTFSFIGNDIFSYIDEDGNICLISLENVSLIKKIDKNNNSFVAVQGDLNGKFLAYTDLKNFYIYDVKEQKEIVKISANKNDKYFKEIYFSSDSNYVFAETEEDSFDVTKEDKLVLHVISTSDAKEINSVSFDAGYVSGMVTKENNVYLLLNNMSLKDNSYNMLIASYNYIDGNVNWTKKSQGWGRFIIRSLPDNSNSIGIAHNDTLSVLNASNGEVIESFNGSSDIINVYAFTNKEMYLLFLSDGSVNYINMEFKNNIEYIGKYEFNINEYVKVTQSENGFLLIPKNENRVILYEKKYNITMAKEENIEVFKNDYILVTEYDKLKEEYDIKNKNLVDKMFYDGDKELLFINYSNNDVAIYNVNDKKLLKYLENVGKANHYFGKDRNNRIYIGDIYDSYILDKDYNKVGHIKGLNKLDSDKVIISDGNDYYSLKIYSLDEMLKEAKEYLK